MIKKRYVMVLSLAVVSVLLGSLLYNSTAQAGKPTLQPDQVEVTNFPLDEQGNLRTTIVQTSAKPKIVVVFNETLTVPSDLYNFYYLTSFNTSGFKYAYIVAKAQGTWQISANIHIWLYENNFGIQTEVSGVAPYISLTTTTPYTPHYGTGKSGKFEIHSTEIDLYLDVYNSNVARARARAFLNSNRSKPSGNKACRQ